MTSMPLTSPSTSPIFIHETPSHALTGLDTREQRWDERLILLCVVRRFSLA